mgnify:CR=1 FL=1
MISRPFACVSAAAERTSGRGSGMRRRLDEQRRRHDGDGEHRHERLDRHGYRHERRHRHRLEHRHRHLGKPAAVHLAARQPRERRRLDEHGFGRRRNIDVLRTNNSFFFRLACFVFILKRRNRRQIFYRNAENFGLCISRMRDAELGFLQFVEHFRSRLITVFGLFS